MAIINPKYNTGRGIASLTPEGRDLLRRCIHANPTGCRSADGECGPPPTYPCFMIAGLSSIEWQHFWSDELDRRRATPLGEEI